MEKPALGQQSTSKNQVISISYKLEPTIWSCDGGQRIPCFGMCQLIITWMSNIRDVHSEPRLLLCHLPYHRNNKIPQRYGEKCSVPWQPARSLLHTQLQANTTLPRGWIPQLVQRKIIKTRENITKKKERKS